MLVSLRCLIHHNRRYRLYCRNRRLGLHIHRLAVELEIRNI